MSNHLKGLTRERIQELLQAEKELDELRARVRELAIYVQSPKFDLRIHPEVPGRYVNCSDIIQRIC